MNYGKIRDDSLRLINQYTIAGSTYAATYNNQQDYLNKIPTLVNSCLLELASSVRKLPATKMLYVDDGEVNGAYRWYVLPEDCLEIRSGGLLNINAKPWEPKYENRYQMLPPDHVLIPTDITDDLVLEYFRRPQLLSTTPADTDPIDADADVQGAIPYYVASGLLLEDDYYRSASFKNQFEDKIARLSSRIYTTTDSVVDVYGLDDVNGGYNV